jgi:SAM-dependent methyltransferase
MSQSAEPGNYIHGHSAAVLSAHARRTAAAFVPYLIPHIQPHHSILDVGCGPGTISADLAALAPSGCVTCLDPSETALDAARAVARERGLTNMRFVRGEVEKLPFGEEFDVVHAHQLVIHTKDAREAIQEMRRVLKPGGILASKDMIISSMAWYPPLPGLDVWRRAMVGSMALTGADPDTGARTKDAAVNAGFALGGIRCSVGSWCFASDEDVRWWGTSVADRLAEGAELRGRVVEGGFLTEREVDEGVDAWRRWAKDPSAWFGVMNGEIVCTK